jgi:DNA-binding response OmpR family regulator
MLSQLANEQRTSTYILIVEDDEALAKMVYDTFTIAGSRCFVIRSKLSAENFLRQVRPDLVILDYQLIGGVGLEAAHIASTMNVPVIVTSGHLNVLERVREAGYFYLPKPFTLTALLDLASMLLGTDLSWPGKVPSRLH